MKKEKEDKKIDLKSLIKKPLFWIGVWIAMPLVFYFGNMIFGNIQSASPLFNTIVIMTPFWYFRMFPFIISALGAWQLFLGILKLRKGENKSGILNTILGIAIILFNILIIVLIKELMVISK